jgi:hypothetical protein
MIGSAMSKAVSAILEDIQALSDEEMALLSLSLSEAMWDEWDCGLDTALENFGAGEWRVAVRTAAIVAKNAEKHQSNTNEEQQ